MIQVHRTKLEKREIRHQLSQCQISVTKHEQENHKLRLRYPRGGAKVQETRDENLCQKSKICFPCRAYCAPIGYVPLVHLFGVIAIFKRIRRTRRIYPKHKI